MKITLINHSDTLGGASVVTFRLMEALRSCGIDARMLVAKKNSESPYVEQFEPSSRLPFLAEHMKIFAHNGLSRKRLFQVSLGSDGRPMSRHPLVTEADAVVLNWVNQGVLSLDETGRIAAMKPTVWTMHDQWDYTGICHHTESCENYKTHCRNCPYLGWMASEHDISSRVFERKKELYDSTEIHFVALSRWIASRARESALLRHSRLSIIPNAFPVERFTKKPSKTRKELGLPEGRKLIVFCAARIDDPGKGLPMAIDILNAIAPKYKDTATAVFVGSCRNPQATATLQLPYVMLGPTDSESIPSIMAHASAVLSTSPTETFSTTMIEAQAAGATPVCLTHDGRGDIVTDGISGYSLGTDPYNLDLKKAAEALISALEHPIAAETVQAAAARYSANEVARQYIRLLEEVIQDRRVRQQAPPED